MAMDKSLRYHKLLGMYVRAFSSQQTYSDEIRRIFSDINIYAWWAIALSQKQEDIEKTICLFYGNDTMSQDRMKEEVLKSQSSYNGLKLSDNAIRELFEKDEEILVRKILPPDSSVSRFLKGKGNAKPTYIDFWLFFCFQLWFSIKAYFYITQNAKSVLANKCIIPSTNEVFRFFSSHITIGSEEIMERMIELDNFIKSPEGFLLTNAPNSPVTQLVYLLLDYWNYLGSDKINNSQLGCSI